MTVDNLKAALKAKGLDAVRLDALDNTLTAFVNTTVFTVNKSFNGDDGLLVVDGDALVLVPFLNPAVDGVVLTDDMLV